MYLTIPKSNKTISIKDWWITFDDKRQVMVGYVCIKNHNQQQVNDGFPFKNLIFIYRKRQVNKRGKPLLLINREVYFLIK